MIEEESDKYFLYNSRPNIEKIIKPNGTLVSGLPASAIVVDESSAMYYFPFVPDMVGDYILRVLKALRRDFC